MTALTISKLARHAHVGVETIRFYQRKGLLEQPDKPPRGYRSYPVEAIQQVRFIRRAKDLGFSLREVSELLSLRVDAQTTCGEVRARTAEKMRDIDRRIADLVRMQRGLRELSATCELADPDGHCQIIHSLDLEETTNA